MSLMNAYHRGRAQGMLLYPRPELNRPLADLLLTALHVEYGKPEGPAAYDRFLAGYAEGQIIMEDAMAKKDGPVIGPSVGTLAYINQLTSMLADAQARAPRWIPVTERMPAPQFGAVLTFSPDEGERILSADNFPRGFPGGVTHWMPLPIAPVAEPVEAAHAPD